MKRKLRIMLAVVTVLVIGCEYNSYTIVITPKGDRFERKLTCKRVDIDDKGNETIRNFPERELEKITAIYASRLPSPETGIHAFSGEFEGKTPNDIGGAGTYKRYHTILGSLSVYTERFRGSDDIEAAAAARRKGADRFVEMAVEYFKTQIDNSEDFAAIRKFLETDFRQDLYNLSFYSWLHQLQSENSKDKKEEALFRFGLYLLERGYFYTADAPRDFRSLSDNPKWILERLQRFLATKLGVSPQQPIPDSLKFLSYPIKVRKSWEAFMRSTDEYKKLLRGWEEQKKEKPDTPEPDPNEALRKVSNQILDIGIFVTTDEVHVILNCRNKPISTNGEWDENNGQVKWKLSVSENPPLPPFCHALWVNPDAQLQQSLFGKVLLTGKNLAEYAFWYHSLSANQAHKWDAFVAGLKPGEELVKKLEAFHLLDEPGADKKEKKDLADTPRNLIMKGLKSGQ